MKAENMAVFRGVLVLLLAVCTVLCDKCDLDLSQRNIPECAEDVPLDSCSDTINCSCGEVGTLSVAWCDHKRFEYLSGLPEIDTLCIWSNDSFGFETADFFANVSSISALRINGNVEFLNPAALKQLKSLTRLSLMATRQVCDSDIGNVLEAVPMLRELDIVACYFTSIAVDGLPSLKYLEVFGMFLNELETLNLDELPMTVGRADFSQNYISSVDVSIVLTNLEEFWMAQNSLNSFPDTCMESGGSYFPALRVLDLAFNQICSMPDRLCLPKLELLLLDQNNFLASDGVRLAGDMFPSLVIVSFAIFDKPDFLFIDLPALECVYLNTIEDFSIDVLINYFVNCSRFRYLDASQNTILVHKELPSHFQLQPNQSLRNVEHLSLASCNLGGKSDRRALPTLVRILPNLVFLDLSSNNLQFISSGLFDGLSKLRRLNLSSNFLTGVSRDLFSDATRGRLQTLNFAENPFDCSCDILWFKSWIESSPSKFVATEDYWCVSGDRVPDIPLLDFNLSEQACLMSHAAYVAITYVTLFSLLFAVITVSFWRYQWHLRLLLYDMFRGPGDARLQRLQHGHFDYDVFVSYDSDDQLWVFGKLLPELEGRLGLKLCLHERDFVPGTQIIDNIAKCVEASKKILMVWSRNFVDSKWCQFELTYCLQHTMDTEDALVIVCLDDVTSTNDVTTAMMAVLKTTTYIQWVGERRGQAALDSFWGRLRVALKEVIPDPVHDV